MKKYTFEFFLILGRSRSQSWSRNKIKRLWTTGYIEQGKIYGKKSVKNKTQNLINYLIDIRYFKVNFFWFRAYSFVKAELVNFC